MNKIKVLKLITLNIQSTKEKIEKAHEHQSHQDINYLNGRLETFEGIKRSIEGGYWD